jgi:hypothetical protein
MLDYSIKDPLTLSISPGVFGWTDREESSSRGDGGAGDGGAGSGARDEGARGAGGS